MAGTLGSGSLKTRAAALMAVVGLAAVSCVPASLNSDGSVAQASPLGVNGMIQESGVAGGEVWVADLFGQQLIRFDADTGVIAERYGPEEGLCGTDDVVVMADDSLVATCPSAGLVIRVPRGGNAEVLAAVGNGVNPIVAEPSGTSVLVGFGSGGRDELLRVHLDGSPVETVADGLPLINGFGFGPDGLLYVPTGGAEGALGTGGLATIDTSSGDFTPIALSFAEAGRTGFDFACGADVAPDGTVFVAQCLNAAAYAVDPDTGEATLVGHSTLDLADNVLVMTDGRVLLSGFFGGSTAVFTPAPGDPWTRSALRIGT